MKKMKMSERQKMCLNVIKQIIYGEYACTNASSLAKGAFLSKDDNIISDIIYMIIAPYLDFRAEMGRVIINLIYKLEEELLEKEE